MEKYDVVESWLANVAYSHSNSKLTGPIYRRQLRLFCEFIGKTPQQIINEYESTKNERSLRRKYARYLMSQIARMVSENYASNTINSLVTAVKSFFSYNDLPLAKVVVGKCRVRFHNRDITKEEIAQILARSSLRDKAIFSMMAQSGLRPGTIQHLRYESVKEELETGIVPLCIRAASEETKGKYGSYFTFIGSEAVNYLKLYLQTRHNLQPNDYLFTLQNNKDKPLQAKVMSKIFNSRIKRLEKEGLITIKNRQYNRPAEVRLYNLRKFFRKHARQAGEDYANFWMGHKTNYKAPHIPASDDYYFNKTDIEFHRKVYARDAMPYLRIGTATPRETEQTIEELRRQLKERNGLIQEQEKRLQSLEKFQRETLERIHELAEFRREMKHFEKGGAVVTYYSKAGFLPKEVEEVADEALERQKEKFLKEAEKIGKVLRRRRK